MGKVMQCYQCGNTYQKHCLKNCQFRLGRVCEHNRVALDAQKTKTFVHIKELAWGNQVLNSQSCVSLAELPKQNNNSCWETLVCLLVKGHCLASWTEMVHEGMFTVRLYCVCLII